MKIGGVRLVLLGAMICLLSGCWVSDSRIIDASSASAIDFEGPWEEAEAGVRSRITITANGDGSYTLGDRDEKLRTFYLALGDGWFVAQYEANPDDFDGEQEAYLFQPVKEEEGVLRLYSPPCDEAAAAFDGVKSDGQACLIGNLDALKAVAADFIRRVDAGELGSEDGVFVRPTEPQ